MLRRRRESLIRLLPFFLKVILMRNQLPQPQRPLLKHLHQRRRTRRIDKPHRHRQVIPPQLLQMDRRFFPMHPDIRNIAPQSNNLLAEFKRCGDPHRFDHHVAAEVVGFAHYRGDGVGGAAADVGAHGFCGIQTGGVVVDHDDLRGGVQEGG